MNIVLENKNRKLVAILLIAASVFGLVYMWEFSRAFQLLGLFVDYVDIKFNIDFLFSIIDWLPFASMITMAVSLLRSRKKPFVVSFILLTVYNIRMIYSYRFIVLYFCLYIMSAVSLIFLIWCAISKKKYNILPRVFAALFCLIKIYLFHVDFSREFGAIFSERFTKLFNKLDLFYKFYLSSMILYIVFFISSFVILYFVPKRIIKSKKYELSDSIEKQLKDIKKKYEKNIISSEEYSRCKDELLKKL